MNRSNLINNVFWYRYCRCDRGKGLQFDSCTKQYKIIIPNYKKSLVFCSGLNGLACNLTLICAESNQILFPFLSAFWDCCCFWSKAHSMYLTNYASFLTHEYDAVRYNSFQETVSIFQNTNRSWSQKIPPFFSGGDFNNHGHFVLAKLSTLPTHAIEIW